MKNKYLSFLLFIISNSLLAADYYTANYQVLLTVNEHGVCRQVYNNHPSTDSFLVPTKTAAEWTAFRNNPPTNTIMCDCTSFFTTEGYCFRLGAAGQNCTTVCASYDGYNSVGTTAYGSSGNEAKCDTLLGNLGAPDDAETTRGDTCGCYHDSDGKARRVWGEDPTAEGCSAGTRSRACACNL